MKKYICLIPIALLLGACGEKDSGLSDYNKALLNLEKNIQQCSDIEKAAITGDKAQNLDDETLRIALTYFYFKNAQACTEDKKEALLFAINKVENDKGIADLIRMNAAHLKRIFIDDKKKLGIEKDKFDALSIENKQRLNDLNVSNRPFKVDLAIEYYLAE